MLTKIRAFKSEAHWSNLVQTKGCAKFPSKYHVNVGVKIQKGDPSHRHFRQTVAKRVSGGTHSSETQRKRSWSLQSPSAAPDPDPRQVSPERLLCAAATPRGSSRRAAL